jgi:hypothetical protein
MARVCAFPLFGEGQEMKEKKKEKRIKTPSSWMFPWGWLRQSQSYGDG